MINTIETEKKIMAFLKKNWLPTTKISRLLTLDYYVIQYALKKLEEQGLVEKKEVGKRIKYWRKV